MAEKYYFAYGSNLNIFQMMKKVEIHHLLYNLYYKEKEN